MNIFEIVFVCDISDAFFVRNFCLTLFFRMADDTCPSIAIVTKHDSEETLSIIVARARYTCEFSRRKTRHDAFRERHFRQPLDARAPFCLNSHHANRLSSASAICHRIFNYDTHGLAESVVSLIHYSIAGDSHSAD